MRAACGFLLALAFLTGPSVSSGQSPQSGGHRYALLVGCTKYASLDEQHWLKGPANDVVLMRNLLQDRFGFASTDIAILSEASGESNRPTRAHIEREMLRLAKAVQRGDQVVILLAGHGSRQPQRNPGDPQNFEPDGMDNIFLPSDVGRWDASAKIVANAIVDDDLKAWLTAIRARGASVLIIVDACHSATMVRGNESEVAREVPAEALAPRAVLEDARKRAEKRGVMERGIDAAQAPFNLATPAPGGIVAIYAAQRTEPTVERQLPADSRDAVAYGLLTYTLVAEISRCSTPITYVDLVARINNAYVASGRNFPTPSVEGPDRYKNFLGSEHSGARVSQLSVKIGKKGEWRIDAGALLGLTNGSVLAVYPVRGTSDPSVGHVRVRYREGQDVIVEPCAYAKAPAPKMVPALNRCEVVYVNYGPMRLRVAVDGNPAAPEIKRVRDALSSLGRAKHSLVEWVEQPARADWLARVEHGKAVLIPGTGLVQTSGPRDARAFGPVPIDDSLGRWLENALTRIARARNLIALAASGHGTGGLHVGVEVLRARPDHTLEPVVSQGSGVQLRDGEQIAFRIRNHSRHTIDVSLLYIDSGYGILSFFPEPDTATDNRIAPRKSIVTPLAKLNSKTVGLEHLVAIAVMARTNQQPIDFGCLEQPTIEQVRGATRGADRPAALASPLGQLLQSALYAEGGSRGMQLREMDGYAMQVKSWRVVPRDQPK